MIMLLAPPEAERAELRICGGNQHCSSKAALRCAGLVNKGRFCAEIARTIAAVGPIAMLPPAPSRHPDGLKRGILAGFRGPAKGNPSTRINLWHSPLNVSGKKQPNDAVASGKERAIAGGGTESVLARIADALERLAPPPPPQRRILMPRRPCLASRGHKIGTGAPCQSGRHDAAQGHRPGSRSPGREYRALRPRPAGQQCAAYGARAAWANRRWSRPRMQRSARRIPDAGLKLDRNPSRGHRVAAGPDGAAASARRNASSCFCDDLSFDAEDTSYKSLKTMLEGGIEGRPDNVIFYATSNRRHLLARDMVENERSTAINPGEAVEEKVSLSDRFGLWLGFHRCSQDEYLAMVEAMSPVTAFRLTARICAAKRSNGRRPRGRARAASPGNTCRIWPVGSACEWNGAPARR